MGEDDLVLEMVTSEVSQGSVLNELGPSGSISKRRKSGGRVDLFLFVIRERRDGSSAVMGSLSIRIPLLPLEAPC